MGWRGMRGLSSIGQFPTIPLHRRDFPIGGILVKRVLDITVSTVALVVGAPVMLAIAIAIRTDSEGKIFYKAQRIGRKGRAFPCYTVSGRWCITRTS